MDRTGILIVSKCLSSSAMVDALLRSDKYTPELYIAEKQTNPFNLERAKEHRVIPDLDISKISGFASRFANRIAFGLCDTEDFVVAGGRDELEKRAGVQMVCVTKKFAVEGSKASQRLLFDRISPAFNPNFKVFDPVNYRDESEALRDFRSAAEEMVQPVIKPDAPARGAGVGVWGSDFNTHQEAETFFTRVYSKGRVVVEERIAGEESSFHAFSDGRHFCAAPLTRDYKRALDRDHGNLTGGMGSYRDAKEHLPFVRESEWSEVVGKEEESFRRWKGRGSEPGLRGIVEYDALMHTGKGFKVLERNSRGGNTESINLFTTLEDDLIDICFRIVEGRLRGLRFRKEASVVTCVVPVQYGNPAASVTSDDGSIDLMRALALSKEDGHAIRVYPMDVKAQDGRTIHGNSRCAATVGIANDVEEARELSLRAARVIRGDLRYRRDIASAADIKRSCEHMAVLRAHKVDQVNR